MDTKSTVEAYISAWNEEDEAKRRELLDQCWDESATYTDPTSDISGRDALFGLISQFQTQMPGAAIAVTSGIDQHHDRIRFCWKLTGAAQAIEGIDVGQVSPDGRLKSIVGFWGMNPPAA